jgi:hypothetical protein
MALTACSGNAHTSGEVVTPPSDSAAAAATSSVGATTTLVVTSTSDATTSTVSAAPSTTAPTVVEPAVACGHLIDSTIAAGAELRTLATPSRGDTLEQVAAVYRVVLDHAAAEDARLREMLTSVGDIIDIGTALQVLDLTDARIVRAIDGVDNAATVEDAVDAFLVFSRGNQLSFIDFPELAVQLDAVDGCVGAAKANDALMLCLTLPIELNQCPFPGTSGFEGFPDPAHP